MTKYYWILDTKVSFNKCWDYRDKNRQLQAYAIQIASEYPWCIRLRADDRFINVATKYATLDEAKAIAEALVAMR